MTCTIVAIWVNSKKKINVLFGLRLPYRGNILKEAKSDMDFQIDINGKYNLAARLIEEQLLPHPFPPLFQTLGMPTWRGNLIVNSFFFHTGGFRVI